MRSVLSSIISKPLGRAAAAAVLGFAFLGASPAHADDREHHRRAVHCDDDDRRGKGRRSDRGGRYDNEHCRRSSVKVRVGNKYDRRYDDRPKYTRKYDRKYDRGYDRRYDRGHRGRRGSEVVYRRVLPARGRARIVVLEEIIYGRRKARRVCTVTPRGPESGYIPYRRLRRVAYNHCSRRARVIING